MLATLDYTPIYAELDARRRLEFNLNTEILIRKHVASGSGLWDSVGEFVDTDGKRKVRHDINLENLRVYLWATLAEAARIDGDPFSLSLEDVGMLIRHKRKATHAFIAVSQTLKQYYGDAEPGEAPASHAKK